MLFPLRMTTSRVGLLPSLSTKVSPAAAAAAAFGPTKDLCQSVTGAQSIICMFYVCFLSTISRSVHNNGPVGAFCGCSKFLLVAGSHGSGTISYNRLDDAVFRPVCILMKLTSRAHLPPHVCLALFLRSCACVPVRRQTNTHLKTLGG